MKNRIKLSFLVLLFGIPGFAQVGIGTTDPQETLHISGNSSTIRVEGLNSENHDKNLGGSSKYNVMVDSEGNLTLGDSSGELNSASSIAAPVTVQTTANSGLNSAELYKTNFTLTQKAIVVITYYISMDFKSYDGTATIDDGRAKIAHNYFYYRTFLTEIL